MSWAPAEAYGCSMFGKAGTPFDFAGADMARVKEKARELEEQQKGMKKKVNPKVINMIDRCAPSLGIIQAVNSYHIAWRKKRLR